MPMEMAKSRSVCAGQPVPRPADLAAPQVRLPQQEEVVELALFTTSAVAFVFAQLVITQAFESFAFAARLMKNSLLLIAQLLQAHEFPLQDKTLLPDDGFGFESKVQFGRGRAGAELLRLARLHFLQPDVELLDEMAYARDLLVGGAQTQFLLMLYTLPEMKHCLEWKMKGHHVSSAEPEVSQRCQKTKWLLRASA